MGNARHPLHDAAKTQADEELPGLFVESPNI